MLGIHGKSGYNHRDETKFQSSWCEEGYSVTATEDVERSIEIALRVGKPHSPLCISRTSLAHKINTSCRQPQRLQIPLKISNPLEDCRCPYNLRMSMYMTAF